MAAGDLSASALQKIMLKVQSNWMSKPTNHAETAVAVKRNSANIQIQAVADPNKDNVVRVTWIDACALDVQDCTTDCDLTADELETKAKDYELDICFETAFSIDREKLRTNTYNFDEFLSEAMQKAITKLDEKWAQQILSKLHTFAGDNAFPQPFTFDGTNNWTIVPDSYFNQLNGAFNLPPIIKKQALQNRMNDVYLIENGALSLEQNNALLMNGANDGASIAAYKRAGMMDITSDLWNFAGAGVNEDIFAIEKNAVAFYTRARYSATPIEIGGKVGQTRFSVASLAIPDVRYDVYHQISCNEDGHIVDTFKIKTEGLVELKPESCPLQVGATTYQNTGVMGYIAQAKTTTPAG